MISRKQRDRAIKIGRELGGQGKFDIKEYLDQHTAISQTKAAKMMDVRPRDVQKFLQPDYIVNSRPKYLKKSVTEWQEEQERKKERALNRR